MLSPSLFIMPQVLANADHIAGALVIAIKIISSPSNVRKVSDKLFRNHKASQKRKCSYRRYFAQQLVICARFYSDDQSNFGMSCDWRTFFSSGVLTRD